MAFEFHLIMLDSKESEKKSMVLVILKMKLCYIFLFEILS